MVNSASFISVEDVNVEYTEHDTLLARLTGKRPFTHSILRDISFAIPFGQSVTLYGQPGAGKTTLLRMLAGVIQPSRGSLLVNGKPAHQVSGLAAGYVSSEESEADKETVGQVLQAYGQTHQVVDLSAKIGTIAEVLGLDSLLNRPAQLLSTTERLRVNTARAALSNSPLILLDGLADELGVENTQAVIYHLFNGRSVIVTTRFAGTAEALGLPILLLHSGTVTHFGTCEAIAHDVGCPRIVDVWFEGLRYDLLRKLRNHSGVEEVRLLPTDQFEGQHLRIRLRSSRYLPALYDLVSQSALVKIEEAPPSLTEILAHL